MRGLLLALLALAPLPALAQAAPTPPANCTAEEHRQFDFWVGEWQVYPTAAPDRHVANSVIEAVYNGCGIRENWQPLSLNTGGSLSYYDPTTRHWHQLWVGSNPGAVAFEGGLVDGQMVLVGFWQDYGGPGQNALVRMRYSLVDPNTVRQHGETSLDHGITWTTGFDFLYRRKPAT